MEIKERLLRAAAPVAPTVEEIEDELDQVLRTLDRHWKQERMGHAKWFDRFDNPPEETITTDPIGSALCSRVRALGITLFNVTGGSLETMRQSLERVARRGRSRPPHYLRRVSLIDQSWSGIGCGRHRWWA